MKVYGADRGGVIGEVERTNGGAWFADWLNSAGDVVALGAFPDKGAAIAAVRASAARACWRAISACWP